MVFQNRLQFIKSPIKDWLLTTDRISVCLLIQREIADITMDGMLAQSMARYNFPKFHLRCFPAETFLNEKGRAFDSSEFILRFGLSDNTCLKDLSFKHYVTTKINLELSGYLKSNLTWYDAVVMQKIYQEVIFRGFMPANGNMFNMNQLNELHHLSQPLSDQNTIRKSSPDLFANGSSELTYKKATEVSIFLAYQAVKKYPLRKEALNIFIDCQKKLNRNLEKQRKNFSTSFFVRKDKLLAIVKEQLKYNQDKVDLIMIELQNQEPKRNETKVILDLYLEYQSIKKSGSWPELIQKRIDMAATCAEFASKIVCKSVTDEWELDAAYFYACCGKTIDPFNRDCYEIMIKVTNKLPGDRRKIRNYRIIFSAGFYLVFAICAYLGYKSVKAGFKGLNSLFSRFVQER